MVSQNKDITTVIKCQMFETLIFFYTRCNILINNNNFAITMTIIIYDDYRTSLEILLLCRQRTTISRNVQYINGRSIIIIVEQCGEAFTASRNTYITHNILYNNIITTVV